MQLSDETIDIGYFSIDSLGDLDILEDLLERIQDAVMHSPSAIIK